jgi:hypothetical protein
MKTLCQGVKKSSVFLNAIEQVMQVLPGMTQRRPVICEARHH